MLTLAVWAPYGIEIEPYARNPKPIPSRIKPIENLTGPLGLNLEAQSIEKIGAKIIINKEFRTENQDAGISVSTTSATFQLNGT